MNEVTDQSANELAQRLRELADKVERQKPLSFDCKIINHPPIRPGIAYAMVKIHWW
ncbi:hypothetical protein [Actinosynnema sp. ALI-1.44]|uniref:hypothetical protein n=1 Tax=Actinosynnema sp. ALI-1.44 TaxID=1933779 RepID=UPI00143D0B6F|nr:hypothetical protein [Actinosynnema sp. ALI-1.44]